MTTAREIMKTNLVTASAEDSIQGAIEKLLDGRKSGLPVTDAEGALVGIITEKDVMQLLQEPKGTRLTVGDLMNREVRTFQADAPLAEVCDCLMASSFRRVPILEGRKLVGLISRADLMPTILKVISEQQE